MVRDTEPDLYPPDEEPTPNATRQRNRALFGTALIVWGTSLLLQRTLGLSFSTGSLAIGAGLLAGWTRLRRYLWFVGGSILTAAGIGDVAAGLLPHGLTRPLSALLLAGGFLAVYVRYPHRSSWALVPAAIFGVVSVGSAGVGLLGLLPFPSGVGLLPALLILAGAVLLFRHSLPPKPAKIALIVLGVMIVSSALGAIGHQAEHRTAFLGPRFQSTTTLPTGDGRPLVITGGSADVHVVIGGPITTVSPSHRGRAALVTSTSDGVQVVVRDDTEIRVAQGTPVRIDLGSGDAEVDSDTPVRLDLRTGSGDLAVNGDDHGHTYQHGAESSPLVEVATGSGSIDVQAPAA